MDGDIISEHFKKSKQNLQSEHDLMVENVKNDISSYKKKALSNAWLLQIICSSSIYKNIICQYKDLLPMCNNEKFLNLSNTE